MADRFPPPDPTPTDMALRLLREATAPSHAALEDQLGLGHPFGLAQYTRVLQGFGTFLGAWEPAMAAALPARLQAWFARGRRLPLLQRDLALLGVRAGASVRALPPWPTLPAAFGSLYVLEGSALGGQHVAAQARRHLGLTADTGAAYFHGAGRGTGARWREFRGLLAQEVRGDAACSQAVHAAQATFAALATTFLGTLHGRAAA